MIIRAKNWAEFQHYKDRAPQWIKLHKRLLDDYEFQCLPTASKALAPMLWLIASETKEGIIDGEVKRLSFRLRMKAAEIEGALSALISSNFFEVVQDSITTLSPLYHDSIPEKRREEREKEKNIAQRAVARFAEFWLVCPKKVGRGAAFKAWRKAITKTDPDTLITAMQRYAASRVGQEAQYTLHPATWLNQERWADEGAHQQRSAPIMDAVTAAEEQENLKRLGLVA